MPLTSGARLGPYEIVAPLGAGGMGEVYRARDTRLGRDVAVKVLPQHLSANAEVRARFEREAKTVSSLNHPHICTLFDVGREGDTDYLVMELVEGETLAARLAKGALAPAEVLRLGAQIADALDRAHRAGVVHRDLKPANVMLTKSGAKLMDFGLARATGLAGPSGGSGITQAALTQSPTVAGPLTAEGTIVGTFQYMSPEQLEGKEADARSDLWALGCVLYEMATGRRAFAGTTQASLISSIMRDKPTPISELSAMAPPALDRLVRRCIEKDADERWQSASDVAHELRWISETGSEARVPAQASVRRKGSERLAWTLAALGVGAASVTAGMVLGTQPRHQVVQAVIDTPSERALTQYACEVLISPPGDNVAYVARDSNGTASLWVRPIASGRSRQIEGARPSWPFWSPDGKYLAYFDLQAGKLMKVAIAGGSPTTVCDSPNGRGGSWNRDGTIVFAPAAEGALERVPAGGGEPVAATALDSSRHERAHRFPCFLPDGDHFLFAVLPGRAGGWEIYAGSLSSRAVKRVMTAGSAPVWAEPGCLLFERDGRVMAQKFDTGGLELRGEAVDIADAPKRSDLDAEPVASASRNGRLVLLKTPPLETRLELLDHAWVPRASFGLPRGPWLVERTSPDGKRAALINGADFWILDLARSVPMRLATSTASWPSIAWAPDGQRVAFVTKRNGREELEVAGLDGRAEALPTTGGAFERISDWSPDGKWIVLDVLDDSTGWDVWLLPMEGDHKPVPFLTGPWGEFHCRVSPDGHWLAYMSDETGRAEVYVESSPRPGRKVRVSPDGGAEPFWRRGGKELMYSRGSTLMAVDITGGADLQPGTPRPLLTIPGAVVSADPLPDGEHFLASAATGTLLNDIRLIIDWKELLRR